MMPSLLLLSQPLFRYVKVVTCYLCVILQCAERAVELYKHFALGLCLKHESTSVRFAYICLGPSLLLSHSPHMLSKAIKSR